MNIHKEHKVFHNGALYGKCAIVIHPYACPWYFYSRIVKNIVLGFFKTLKRTNARILNELQNHYSSFVKKGCPGHAVRYKKCDMTNIKQ